MALQILNITDEPHQRHTILTDDGEITLMLRFLPAVQVWYMDVEYNGAEARGIKLSAAVSHVRGFNFPFDFVLSLTDGSGIDPFRTDDFVTGRCELYFVTREEMFTVRGIEVPA